MHFTTHLVKVDGHGAVAHLGGLMVGASDGWKGHPTSSGPHRHAQSATWRLSWGGWVAHHQTLSLQHNRLCVILTTHLWWSQVDKKEKSNKKDVAMSKVVMRWRRWTGHSSKWNCVFSLPELSAKIFSTVRQCICRIIISHRHKSSGMDFSHLIAQSALCGLEMPQTGSSHMGRGL